MNKFKTPLLMSVLPILLNQNGYIGFGRRFPLMSDDPGAAGGGAGTPPNPNPATPPTPPSNTPDFAADLKKLQDSVVALTQQNTELKKQVNQTTQQSIEEKIKNESDPNKVVKLLKDTLQSEQEANKQLKKSIIASNIRSTLQRVAGDKVHDVSDLLNQPEFRDILKSGLDSDKMDIDETIAVSFVDKLLEKKPYLKKGQPAAGAITAKPGQSTKGKAVSEMSVAEIEAELKRIWK